MQLHLRIHGQVQGVFFHYSAKEQAENLGLVGWIRNNLDGSVEALAEGERDKLEQFIIWCRKGPPGAEVQKLKVEWSKEEEQFSTFDII